MTANQSKNDVSTSTANSAKHEDKVSKRTKNTWLKWVMGLILVGSATGLLYLISARNKWKY
jgi:hypothetical protein